MARKRYNLAIGRYIGGMPLCRTCKHYSVKGLDKRQAEHGECYSPKFVRSYHAAFAPHDREKWWQGIPPDGVHVESDEGWGMLVGPDFGCVHWMQREDD